MTVRARCLLTTAVALWLTQVVAGQEPAPLGLKSTNPLPAPSQPTANQRIANTIADQLHQSGNLRHYTVHIAFQNGVADLSGTVADQPQREEAIRLVQGIPGVERVHDRLTLAGSIAQVQELESPAAQSAVPLPPPTPVPPGGGPGTGMEPMPISQGMPGAPNLNPPNMPPYAWPTYAPYNNYSRVAYPNTYPYQAFPYIGPIYPYPKIPLGWRKVHSSGRMATGGTARNLTATISGGCDIGNGERNREEIRFENTRGVGEGHGAPR